MSQSEHFFPMNKGELIKFSALLGLIGLLLVLAGFSVLLDWYLLGFENVSRFGKLAPITVIGGLALLYVVGKPFLSKEAGLFVGENAFGLRGVASAKHNIHQLKDIKNIEKFSIKLIPGVLWSDNLLRVTLATNGRKRTISINCDLFDLSRSEVEDLLLKKSKTIP